MLARPLLLRRFTALIRDERGVDFGGEVTASGLAVGRFDAGRFSRLLRFGGCSLLFVRFSAHGLNL
jgi:hypothetical protein